MSQQILAFRTITRCGIFYQVRDTTTGVVSLVPVPLSAPPKKITINPGDNIEELTELACDGTEVIGLSYPKDRKPEIELEFSSALPDLDGILANRIVQAATGSVNVMVYAEFKSDNVPAARTSGQIGFSAVAQTPTSGTQMWYIDPLTKLAKPISILSTGTPTGDQATIGASLLFGLSPELIAKKTEIYAWVPCAVSGTVLMSSTPIGLMSIFAQGINFDGSARLLTARNCSRLPGGAISSDSPARQLKFRVNSDPASQSGLGWDWQDTSLANAC